MGTVVAGVGAIGLGLVEALWPGSIGGLLLAGVIGLFFRDCAAR